MRSNYSRTKLLGFCSPGAIHKYFNSRIFGRRCCITVKIDVKQTHALCPIFPLLPLQHRFNYDQRFVAYQLIIWLPGVKRPTL